MDSIKYLGVTITHDLRCNTHISNMFTKANRTLGFLRRNLYQCPQDVKEAAYRGLGHPILECGSCVWDPQGMVPRVASGPRVKLASCKSALTPHPPPPWFTLLTVLRRWFILRGDLFYVLPCVILFLCFSVLLALRLPRLGKKELILVLFVRLFDLRLFGFVCFLFLLVSGKGWVLWLWHSLVFSLTVFFFNKKSKKVQNRAATFVISNYCFETGSTTWILENLKWEPFKKRRRDSRLILFIQRSKGCCQHSNITALQMILSPLPTN